MFRKNVSKNCIGQHDNRGLSLIELVISIAISSIILGAAGFFLATAIKNYFVAKTAIDLQEESQIFTEQISKWCMESNYSEVYTTPAGNEVLVIYSIPEYFLPSKWPHGVGYHAMPGTSGSVRVVWKKDEKVYTAAFSKDFLDASADYPAVSSGTDIDSFIGSRTSDDYLLLESVETFTPTTALVNIDPTGATTANVTEVVNIKLKLNKTFQTFEMADEILVRNELISQFSNLRSRMAGIR